MSFLDGYKTYIVGVVAIAYAGTQFWSGALTTNELMAAVFAALAAMGLRRGQTVEAQKSADK